MCDARVNSLVIYKVVPIRALVEDLKRKQLFFLTKKKENNC